MNYNCLQDVIDDIYNAYVSTDPQDLDWNNEEFLQGLIKFGDKESLLEVLAESFAIWDEAGRSLVCAEGEYCLVDEPASWCFYYIYKALPFLKDPSVIPEMVQYFPYSPDRSYMYHLGDDMLSQMMVEAVLDKEHFSLDYIFWLMRSLHNVPYGEYDSGFAAELLSYAVGDTFDSITPETFPEHLPAVDVLPLCNYYFILNVLNSLIHDYNAYVREDLKKGESVRFRIEGLVCFEYVRDQLLLLKG